MHRRLRWAAAAACVLGMTGTRAPADSLRPLATAAQGSDSQVFSGATLVQEGAVLRNAVLVVRDGRIESVQPGGAVAPAGVKPVLLTGKYLLPIHVRLILELFFFAAVVGRRLLQRPPSPLVNTHCSSTVPRTLLVAQKARASAQHARRPDQRRRLVW